MDGIFELVCEKSKCNPEYTINKERATRLGRKIMELLGPDKALFLEYENTSSLADGINIENAFQIGLIEGIKLIK